MLPVGSLAPDFTLKNQNDEPFQLSSFRGKSNVLLVFLPAAFTPICSTELPALSVLARRFVEEANAVPAAITVDNVPSNLAWSRQCGGTGVHLLSDFNPHGAISRAYGAWLPDEGLSDRASVLVGRDGKVLYQESAGKFGKRSVQGLLDMAVRANGGNPTRPARTTMPLDLPVLYVTSRCPHCQNVRQFLRGSGLSERVVCRVVDQDATAMQELLGLGIEQVPTLRMPDGRTVTGEQPIVDQLTQAAQ